MKYVKVFNLVTGDKKFMRDFDYFKTRISDEMNDAYDTIKRAPDIGTVKDGSRLKYAQELKYVLENVLVESDDWKDCILSYVTKRKNNIDSFIAGLTNKACINLCIGVKLADCCCENIINEIIKYEKRYCLNLDIYYK